MFEFNAGEAVAAATGDLTGDGQVEGVIGTGSGVSWYSPPIVTQGEGQTRLESAHATQAAAALTRRLDRLGGLAFAIGCSLAERHAAGRL